MSAGTFRMRREAAERAAAEAAAERAAAEAVAEQAPAEPVETAPEAAEEEVPATVVKPRAKPPSRAS